MSKNSGNDSPSSDKRVDPLARVDFRRALRTRVAPCQDPAYRPLFLRHPDDSQDLDEIDVEKVLKLQQVATNGYTWRFLIFWDFNILGRDILWQWNLMVFCLGAFKHYQHYKHFFKNDINWTFSRVRKQQEIRWRFFHFPHSRLKGQKRCWSRPGIWWKILLEAFKLNPKHWLDKVKYNVFAYLQYWSSLVRNFHQHEFQIVP